MSTDVFEDLAEIELDPAGYAPRADLFARNLTRQPVSFNLGRVRWLLGAQGNVDDSQPLPWTVARSTGFMRVWSRGDVEVALDPDFERVVIELPTAANIQFRPHVHVQSVPQSVTTITHGHARPGPVFVALYSPDGQTEYFNFHTEPVNNNTVRIVTDDPIPFIATVF